MTTHQLSGGITMITTQLILEKYFDDGVVQYWRPKAASYDYSFQYRITVEPTWISIDILGRSWTNHRCWMSVNQNIKTFDEATAILGSLLIQQQRLPPMPFLVSEGSVHYRLALLRGNSENEKYFPDRTAPSNLSITFRNVG